MHSIISKIISLSIFLISFLNLNGQIMYPGDVTNNGEVNGVDVLYLGVAYGLTGDPRAGADTDWTPQDISIPWATTFFNGLNHAYADCDGDGIIDEEDIDVIADNFGETQPTITPDVFSNGTNGVDPIFSLTKTSGPVGLNSTVDFALDLGSAALPVNDFYGIAFTLNYDPNIFVDSDFEFELEEGTWITTTIGNDFDDLETWEVEDQVPGEINLAITRNDQMPISGGGQIGKFSIVVEDIIVGLIQDTTTLIQISKVKMITEDMSESSVYSDTFPLLISDTTISLSQIEENLESELTIFPNPMTNYLTINSHNISITNIALYDFLGKKIPIHFEKESPYQANVKPFYQLPAGVYTLSVLSEKGILTRKILVMK